MTTCPTRARKPFVRAAILAVSAGAAAVALAGPASANTLAVSVVCQHPIGQHCLTPFTTSVDNHGEGIFVQFTASPEHCSSIVATLRIDGTILATETLAPGQQMSKQFIAGTGKPGKQLTTIAVTADGVLGGCNVGTLGGWKGTLLVKQFEL
jgi:hypothetical protein